MKSGDVEHREENEPSSANYVIFGYVEYELQNISLQHI